MAAAEPGSTESGVEPITIAGRGDPHVEAFSVDEGFGDDAGTNAMSPMGQLAAEGRFLRSGVLRRPGWPRTVAIAIAAGWAVVIAACVVIAIVAS